MGVAHPRSLSTTRRNRPTKYATALRTGRRGRSPTGGRLSRNNETTRPTHGPTIAEDSGSLGHSFPSNSYVEALTRTAIFANFSPPGLRGRIKFRFGKR